MRKFADIGLDNKWIIRNVQQESARQILKWGYQIHTVFEWLTYTTEELGSLAKAISENEYRNGSKEKVVSEAVQVATLALKIAKMVELDCFEKEEK